ncbi:hypothetical protein H9P43_009826 [Blastocladiella emersonii ATCC 22665]|nr:hypothetical protein H9P43_009826 [Blastocladiella emersonii ATCC 22665]
MHMKLAALLAALCFVQALLTSAVAAQLQTIRVRVVPPVSQDLLQAPISGGKVYVNMTSWAPVTSAGAIDLALDVGTHRVSLDHPQFLFGDLLITVPADGTRARAAWSPLDRSNRYAGKPLDFSPTTGEVEWAATARRTYFDERQAFNPLALLQNPMMLMSFLSLGMVFVLPKLAAALDETKGEVKEDAQSALAKHFKSL